MVLGFNHNIVYKGEVFHVQTEDSGAANPHFVTLLYKGGVILGSRKTSYADILKVENLEEVVEELMKEQHKEMMRRLKSGEFDRQAFGDRNHSTDAAPPGTSPEQSSPAEVPFPAPPSSPVTPSSSDISLLFEMPGTRPAAPAPAPSSAPVSPKNLMSLDDAILSFFGADEK